MVDFVATSALKLGAVVFVPIDDRNEMIGTGDVDVAVDDFLTIFFFTGFSTIFT
jgi:hypothetical protein